MRSQQTRYIEKSVASLPANATAQDIAVHIVAPDVKVVPVRRIRGNRYEAPRLSGTLMRDAWDCAATNERDALRNFKDTDADAVGIMLADGSHHLLDPDTRTIVRFVEYIDAWS
jgi:hypothetical protein